MHKMTVAQLHAKLGEIIDQGLADATVLTSSLRTPAPNLDTRGAYYIGPHWYDDKEWTLNPEEPGPTLIL